MTAVFFDLKYIYNSIQHILTSVFFELIHPSIATLTVANSQIPSSIAREVPYINQQRSCLNVEFEVLKTDNTRYADDDDIQLVKIGPVAFLRET